MEPLLKRSIKDVIIAPFRHRLSQQANYVEALRGISFQIYEGDRVGIIGANGAGKSTLLRTIAGVYPVDEGRARIRGRVNSLFDLGVGFEMSESGRANIYMRGYLLGFTKAEIAELESEIIEFAGLGEFIDLPLKSYSAGMQVRLAFAISTAIESEILLLDEVIGAGDAEFQGRAQNRLQRMIEDSTCLVLVSHDLNQIKEFCTIGMWLEGGTVKFLGPSDEAIARYTEHTAGPDRIFQGNSDFAGRNSNRATPALIDFVRTRPNWANAYLERKREGLELLSPDIPGSFTAEFPLMPYFLRPGVNAVRVRVDIDVIDGEIFVGIIDTYYIGVIGEEVFSEGADQIFELNVSRDQHPAAIMFRSGSLARASRVMVRNIDVLVESSEELAGG